MPTSPPMREMGHGRGRCEIVSTQSKGYDSTAVNTLARAYGIDKVFTVSKAKSNCYLAHNDDGKLPDDDGGEICAVARPPMHPAQSTCVYRGI